MMFKTIENLLISDQQSKIEWHDLISKLQKDKNLYYKDIDFSHEFIDVQFSGGDYEFLTKAPTEKETKRLIKYWFDVENSWYCMRCENRNITKKDPIGWSRWHTYKPLELYPSIFNNKKELSEIDLIHLDNRRESERVKIDQVDKYGNQQLTEWYIIDYKWITDWKMFVKNTRYLNALGSKKAVTKGVGILDPGPISNHNLFDEYGQMKQGLKNGVHYCCVNSETWKILYDIYSGGPIIKRVTPDLYSLEIDANEEAKLIEKKIKKCKRLDKKKIDKRINKFKENKEKVREELKESNFHFDSIIHREGRTNSFGALVRNSHQDRLDESEPLPSHRNRSSSNHNEIGINKQSIKKAVVNLWSGLKSTMYNFMNEE